MARLHPSRMLCCSDHAWDQYPQLLPRSRDMHARVHRSGQQSADHIEDHCTVDLRLHAIAATASLSPFHFSRVFPNFMGMSPYAYMLHCRIKRTQAMLADTQQLSTIAYDASFFDQSHLSEHFANTPVSTPAHIQNPSADSVLQVSRIDEIHYVSSTFKIVGNLYLPKIHRSRYPVLIWVPGSGPSFRSVKNKETIRIINTIMENGFAYFQIDKPGGGSSKGALSDDSLFAQLSNIFVDAARELRSHTSIDTTRIGVFGSSQAGYIMPLIIVKDKREILPGTDHNMHHTRTGCLNEITSSIQSDNYMLNDQYLKLLAKWLKHLNNGGK